MRKQQQGFSIYSLIYVFITMGFVLFIAMKVFTPMMEYLSIKKVLSSMAVQELKDGASVADIRKGFDRRSTIDNITAVKPEDLEITKDGNDTIVTAEWQVKIPLFAMVSLMLDFKVTSSSI